MKTYLLRCVDAAGYTPPYLSRHNPNLTMMTQTLRPRSARVQTATTELFDVLVIGGGIHGATAARDAALRGYQVLLLESRDFAYGTSSRSSKMLHGGVRYLEQGNIALVYEALAERDYWLWAAPHLTTSKAFLFPILPGLTRSGIMIHCGLGLYDALASLKRGENTFPWHQRVVPSDPDFEALKSYGLQCASLYRYFDGQMDDARLVVEAICDAATLGVTVLNYAEVERCVRRGSQWHILWKDGCTNERLAASARFIINAAGPWAPKIRTDCAIQQPQAAVFSRGSHLIFSRPWNHPGVILPTRTKGRYYFVWPFFSPCGERTLVGTTDVAIARNEESPAPSEEEIQDLLSLLKRDLPAAGFNENAITASFAGVRILGTESNTSLLSRLFPKRSVSDVSRKDVILAEEGIVSLIGGKFTSARKTAERLVDAVDVSNGYTASAIKKRHHSHLRTMPGGCSYSEDESRSIEHQLVEHNRKFNLENAEILAHRAMRRFGMQASALLAIESRASREQRQLLPCMAEEILFSINHEFVESLDDLASRRLGLLLDGAMSPELSTFAAQLGLPTAI